VNAGTLQLSGSGLISTAAATVFGGTLDLNGTSQSITTLELGGGASGSVAGVSIGAGELKLGGNVTYSATNDPNGASISSSTGFLSLMGNRTFSVGNASATADLTVSAIIQNGDATARSLTKDGVGTMVLSSANTYSGDTTVQAGALIVNGTLAAASDVAVESGGTLKGSGSIGGSVYVSGTLAAGNSPGVLTVSGTTTLESGSIFEWELDTAQSNPTTNRGVAYDGINTTSLSGSGAIFKILLTSTQDFSDYAFWGQTRTWTDIFKSADGSTTLSDWASVFSGGFQYSYNGNTVAPTGAGSFTLTGNSLTWSAVPEPSNALAGLLVAGALLRRRREV
jgi:autotransporter-associated beta strand protein